MLWVAGPWGRDAVVVSFSMHAAVSRLINKGNMCPRALNRIFFALSVGRPIKCFKPYAFDVSAANSVIFCLAAPLSMLRAAIAVPSFRFVTLSATIRAAAAFSNTASR